MYKKGKTQKRTRRKQKYCAIRQYAILAVRCRGWHILLLRGIFGTPTFVTLLPNQISIHPLLKLSQIEKWMDYYWGWPGLNR